MQNVQSGGTQGLELRSTALYYFNPKPQLLMCLFKVTVNT